MKNKTQIECRSFSDENAAKVYVQELSKKYPELIVSIGYIVFGDAKIYGYDSPPRFSMSESMEMFQNYAYRNGIKFNLQNYRERLTKLEHEEEEASYTADR